MTRKLARLLTLLALALALAEGAAPPAAVGQTLAVTGATVIDPLAEAPLEDGVVVMTDGRITAVGAAGAVDVPAGTSVIDARGQVRHPRADGCERSPLPEPRSRDPHQVRGPLPRDRAGGRAARAQDGADDRLRHLGPAGGPGEGARYDQRGRGAREPDLLRRQHHRLRRTPVGGLPRSGRRPT